MTCVSKTLVAKDSLGLAGVTTGDLNINAEEITLFGHWLDVTGDTDLITTSGDVNFQYWPTSWEKPDADNMGLVAIDPKIDIQIVSPEYLEFINNGFVTQYNKLIGKIKQRKEIVTQKATKRSANKAPPTVTKSGRPQVVIPQASPVATASIRMPAPVAVPVIQPLGSSSVSMPVFASAGTPDSGGIEGFVIEGVVRE